MMVVASIRFAVCLTPFFVMLAACAPATTPAPTSTPVSLQPSPTPREVMVHASPAPGELVPAQAPATAMPATTALAGPPGDFQTLALIQELYEFRYLPDPLILQANVPVELYAVTTAAEHVNQWQIGPFKQATNMRPGQVFTFAFTPEQAGEFQVSNVGHGFGAGLMVATDCTDVERLHNEQGFQAFAVIHSPADGLLYPQTITVRLGLPVRLYHISVSGDHRVSIETLVPEAMSVDSKAIALMEFNPSEVGEFAIRHLDDELTGHLVVEETPCLSS
ncbi:MAG: hypothetical protein O6949_05110 [Chloroflexi bacterium]|nr:hypothetical protein [Chloroflexota bacterium]